MVEKEIFAGEGRELQPKEVADTHLEFPYVLIVYGMHKDDVYGIVCGIYRIVYGMHKVIRRPSRPLLRAGSFSSRRWQSHPSNLSI